MYPEVEGVGYFGRDKFWSIAKIRRVRRASAPQVSYLLLFSDSCDRQGTGSLWIILFYGRLVHGRPLLFLSIVVTILKMWLRFRWDITLRQRYRNISRLHHNHRGTESWFRGTDPKNGFSLRTSSGTVYGLRFFWRFLVAVDICVCCKFSSGWTMFHSCFTASVGSRAALW